jgi:hypothetical protein
MEKSVKVAFAGLVVALAIVSTLFAAYASNPIIGADTDVGNEFENKSEAISPINFINSTSPSYLYVQNADSGTLTKEDGTYKLTLNGISSTTVSFSDRPERTAHKLATQDFVDQWSTGIGSFEDDPPNAALVIYEGDTEETLVLELQNPVYANGTLHYDVSFLNSDGVISTRSHGTSESEWQIPHSFAQAALFIDDSPPGYCAGTPPDLPPSTPAKEVGAYGAGYGQGFSDGESCISYYVLGGDPNSPPGYCAGTPPEVTGVSAAEVGAYGAGYGQGFSDGESCMSWYARGGN